MNKKKYACPNSFKDWVKKTSNMQKKAIAAFAGTSVNVLYQITCGATRPSPERALQLHRGMIQYCPNCIIPLHDLRPDIWSRGSIPP